MKFHMILQHRYCWFLGILAVMTKQSMAVAAPVTQAFVGLHSPRMVQGVDLTQAEPAVSVLIDWNSEQNLFAQSECFSSTVDSQAGVSRGCDISLGWFGSLPTNTGSEQALSFSLTERIYDSVGSPKNEFGFTSLRADWHLNRLSRVSIEFAPKWFDIDPALTVSAHRAWRLNDRWKINATARWVNVVSNPVSDNVVSAEISAVHQQERWTTSFHWWINDNQVNELLPLKTSSSRLGVNLRYQFY